MTESGLFVFGLMIWCSFLLQFAEPYLRADPVLVMCHSSNYVEYDNKGSGSIVSPGNFIKTPCTLDITACSRCRIQLNFTELSSVSAHYNESHTQPVTGCDYLFVSEPGQYDLYKYFTPANTIAGSVFVSQTRKISIRYCGPVGPGVSNFSINYTIIEKNYTVHGRSPDSGVFTSLGFPNGFGPNGDTLVYHIRNDDKNGFIRLSFDDWHLTPQCLVRIIMNNSMKTAFGSSPRPFVISDGPNITVEVTFATNAERFIGFKAHYEFVTSQFWSDKPVYVDEFYLDSNLGGKLECECRKYSVNGWADFLWVIARSPLFGNESAIMLRLLQPTLQSGDTLEIRRGISSDGDLLSWNRPMDYFSKSGLYIRLRMRCKAYREFRAVFAWIKTAGSSYYPSGCNDLFTFRCTVKNYCIPQSLVCDGVDHCGDRSDERNCTSFVTERPPSNCYAFFRCEDRLRTICEHKRCNGVSDCDDSSDEHSCDRYPPPDDRFDDPYRSYTMLATVIPVVMGTVITFVVIFAVIGFVVQRRRHQAAVNRVREMVRDSSAMESTDNPDIILPSGFSDGDADFSDSERRQMIYRPSVVTCPPSYEATITSEQVVTDDDVPPPYSANAGPGEQSGTDKDSSVETREVSSEPPAYDIGAEHPGVIPPVSHPLHAPNCSSEGDRLMSR